MFIFYSRLKVKPNEADDAEDGDEDGWDAEDSDF